MNYKLSKGDKILHAFIIIVMSLVLIATIYPFWYLLIASFSDANKLNLTRGIVVWFQGFSVEAYKLIFRNNLIWQAYGNTIVYTACGTTLNIFMTTIGAYALSRRGLYGSGFIMKMLVFTMYFSGGLIPSFLLMDQLGLIDSRFALILPGAISVYNLIILRTSFLSIPKALEEAATIDGASPIKIMTKIIIPLSLPAIMVIGLFYMVGHWNSYYSALIYIRDNTKYPLQLVLRNILIENNVGSMMSEYSFVDQRIGVTVKYAVIMVSVVPIIAVYPFIQKYFVQGVMVGSIKE